MKKLLLIGICMFLLIPLASASDWYGAYWTGDTDFCDFYDTNCFGFSQGTPLIDTTTKFLGAGSFDVRAGKGLINSTLVDLSNYSTLDMWVYFDNQLADSGIFEIDAYTNGLSMRVEGGGNQYSIYADGSNAVQTTGGKVPDGEWHHFIMTWNTTEVTLFMDGHINKTGLDTLDLSFTDLELGYGGSWSANGNLYIDNVFLSHNQYRADGEVIDSYNSGAGTIFVEIISASGVLDLLFRNSTGGYETTFDEGENFYIQLNYTDSINNSPITNGFCDIALVEGLIEIDIASSSNFTLCGTGCNNQTYITPVSFTETSNASENLLHFDACHEQLAQGNIEVNISCGNNVYSKIVPSGSYPLCSIGTAKIFVNTTTCSNNATLNISIFSNVINNRRKQISNIELDREFKTDMNHNGTDVVYNASIGMYDIMSHYHEYYKNGLKNISAECYNADANLVGNVSEQITIVNQPPLITLGNFISPTGITYSAVNNVVLEYEEGLWMLSIAIIDDDFTLGNATLYNNTGGLLLSEQANVKIGQFNFSSALVRDFNQPFNITIFANDTSLAQDILGIQFNFSDTSAPICTGFTNTSIANNTAYTWGVSCTDESFFSLNVTCVGSSNFTHYDEGLSTTSYPFTNSTTITENTTCQIEYCDGHTAVLIPEFDITGIGVKKTIDRKVSIEYEGVMQSFDLVKIFDRYLFDIETNFGRTYDEFTITSDEYIYIMDQTKYIGHIVTGDYWIDFETDNVKRYEVTRISDKEVLVRIDFQVPTKSVRYNSIGKLNCVSLTQEMVLSVSQDDIFELNRFECDITSTGKAVFLVGIIFMFIVLFITCLHFKIPVLNIIVGLVMAYFGWYIATCFFLANMLFIVLGIMLMLLGVSEALS